MPDFEGVGWQSWRRLEISKEEHKCSSLGGCEELVCGGGQQNSTTSKIERERSALGVVALLIGGGIECRLPPSQGKEKVPRVHFLGLCRIWWRR